MKCGLYDENYKIAADTNLLVNYLYNCHLKVAYLPEFVTRMRMGGMSTDAAKRKKVGMRISGYIPDMASSRDIDEADENGMESAAVHQGKVYEVDSGIPKTL